MYTNLTLEKIDAEFPGSKADSSERLQRQVEAFIKRNREKNKDSHKQWFLSIHKEHLRNESAKAMATNTDSGCQSKVEELRNGFHAILTRFQNGELRESDVMTAETIIIMQIRDIAKVKPDIN